MMSEPFQLAHDEVLLCPPIEAVAPMLISIAIKNFSEQGHIVESIERAVAATDGKHGKVVLADCPAARDRKPRLLGTPSEFRTTPSLLAPIVD